MCQYTNQCEKQSRFVLLHWVTFGLRSKHAARQRHIKHWLQFPAENVHGRFHATLQKITDQDNTTTQQAPAVARHKFLSPGPGEILGAPPVQTLAVALRHPLSPHLYLPPPAWTPTLAADAAAADERHSTRAPPRSSSRREPA